MSFGQAPDRPNLEGSPRLRQIQGETQNKLVNAKLDFQYRQQELQVEKTVGQWVRDAQRNLANPALHQTITDADNALEGLPPDLKEQWRGHLKQLTQLSTQQIRESGGTVAFGNPVAVVGLVAEMQSVHLPGLRATTNRSQNQASSAAVTKIEHAFAAAGQAVGALHPAIAPYRLQEAKTGLAAQESQIVRGAVVIGAGGLAVATGLLAFFSSSENRSVAFPVAYGLVALGAAGYPRLASTATERLDAQTAFLVEPNGLWRKLQPRHGLRGQYWSTFAGAVFENSQSNGVVTKYLQIPDPDPEKRKEQRAAIIALAPPGLQRQIAEMPEEDLRAILAQLQKATSRDARDIVVSAMRGNTLPGDVQRRPRDLA